MSHSVETQWRKGLEQGLWTDMVGPRNTGMGVGWVEVVRE